MYVELLYQYLIHLNPSISISENVVNWSTFFHATECHTGLKLCKENTARMTDQNHDQQSQKFISELALNFSMFKCFCYSCSGFLQGIHQTST